jgi:hypothetical protein
MAQATKSNPYDANVLLLKAQVYIQEMQVFEANDWRFAFWSALVLEILARAALSKISPVLLADGNDWNNIYLALGHEPTSSKFTPKSITIAEVFIRLQSVNAKFTPELRGFCSLHTGHRNAELHSAEAPFTKLDAALWLPNFFDSCQVLAEMLSVDLIALFGQDVAKTAQEMVSAATDKAAESVKADIAAHTKVWLSKTDAQKISLASQSDIYSAAHLGHVIPCPACESNGLLTGEPMAPPSKDHCSRYDHRKARVSAKNIRMCCVRSKDKWLISTSREWTW